MDQAMDTKGTWSVELFLGTERAVFGRIRTPERGTEVGHGRTKTYEDHPALSSFRDAANHCGVDVELCSTELSRRYPDRDAGLLQPDQAGFFGGCEVQFADFAVAAWGAAGGAAGVITFLKMLREIQALWKGDQTVEVSLKDGTKIKVSSRSGIDVAVAAIQALEHRLSDRTDAEGAGGDDGSSDPLRSVD